MPREAMDDMKMKRPKPLARNAGRNCRATKKAPVRFVSRTLRQSSSVVEKASPACVTAAFATTTCTVPKSSST